MPATKRNCGCQSKGKNDERYPQIQERLDHPGHMLQPLEHKTLSLSIPGKKNENILELEDKLGKQPHTNIFLPNMNSLPRKNPVPKKAEKKKRAKAPVKRRFKVRVIAQPMPTNPTLPENPPFPAEPTVVASMVTTQMPVAKSAVYNLAQGKFKGIPYPTRKFQEGEGPSVPSCNKF